MVCCLDERLSSLNLTRPLQADPWPTAMAPASPPAPEQAVPPNGEPSLLATTCSSCRSARYGSTSLRLLRYLLVPLLVLLVQQRAHAAKTYSFYWWDISLLRSEGHHHADYTGLQKQLVDGGAVNRSLLHTAREYFLKECVIRMHPMQWNCSRTTQRQWSSDVPALPPPYFGKFLDLSTRQAAFIHALSTAVLLQEMISKEVPCGAHCSILNREPCEMTRCTTQNFKCCQDLVEIFVSAGDRKGRKMTNETYTNRVMINQHNRMAGIKAMLSRGLKEQQNCFGISGVCSFKHTHTIIRAEEAAQYIRGLYDRADEIKIVKDYLNTPQIVKKNAQISHHRIPIHDDDKPRKEQLIYARKSPNFCRRRYGLPGPSGRQCDIDGTDDGLTCDILCCGRGYVTRVVEYHFPQCKPEQQLPCCYTACVQSSNSHVMTFCR
ncbi:protein Wnt-4-like [Sycon ciliatum]|uniref:protein Wnt-4-like n=1 Tax=Sycon ciliatum TaxID=27933 RepID=UPI0031F635BE